MYLGSATTAMGTGRFWLTILLCCVVLLMPVVAERFYAIDTRPTLTDKVRIKQKVSKAHAKSRNLILRRASSRGTRHTHKTRSGYAFAHSEGFGKLIMSGVNMLSRSQMELEGHHPPHFTVTQSQPNINPPNPVAQASSKSPKARNSRAADGKHGTSNVMKSKFGGRASSDTSVTSDSYSFQSYSTKVDKVPENGSDTEGEHELRQQDLHPHTGAVPNNAPSSNSSMSKPGNSARSVTPGKDDHNKVSSVTVSQM